MGKKIENMVSLAQEQLGQGILQDITLTRLKYVIGNEVLKNAGRLEDGPVLAELVQNSISSLSENEQLEEYTGTKFPENQTGAKETTTGTPSKPEPAKKAPGRFVLKLKKNNSNGQVELFSTGMLFLPVIMENELFTLLETNLESSVSEEIFSLAKVSARELLENSLPTGSKEAAIRSGLALLRGMGYARHRITQSSIPWSIDFTTEGSHPLAQEFIHGYLNTLFDLVYRKEFSIVFETSSDSSFTAIIQEEGSPGENR